MNEKYNVYLVSDSTGETLDRIFLSLKSQFSNFEYETRVNEGKRGIQILRPEYISLLDTDIRNMMQYSRSSQYVNGRVKRAYNPRTNR